MIYILKRHVTLSIEFYLVLFDIKRPHINSVFIKHKIVLIYKVILARFEFLSKSYSLLPFTTIQEIKKKIVIRTVDLLTTFCKLRFVQTTLEDLFFKLIIVHKFLDYR